MKYHHGCILLLSTFIFFSVKSQYYFSANNKEEPELLWEAGVSAGVMNCLTDLGGKKGAGKKFTKDINWNKTRFCGSLFVSATWHSIVTVRLDGTWGEISASDNVLKGVDGVAQNRYLRNLDFRSRIFELFLLTELHPLFLNTSDNAVTPLLSPYVAAGIGGFHYRPQARLNNTWVDLRPLHTEGQGFKEYPGRAVYNPITWCIPLGAGIRYDNAGSLNLRFEILYRITGTDYLDDVSHNYIDPSLFSKYLTVSQTALASQLADRTAALNPGSTHAAGEKRGNSNDKDAYFSFNFKISKVFGRGRKK